MTLIRCLQNIGGVTHNVSNKTQIANNNDTGDTIKFDDNSTTYVVPKSSTCPVSNPNPPDCGCGTSEPKNPHQVMLF